jgi:hypothetical protein
MNFLNSITYTSEWKDYEKQLFRFSFIFFLFLIIPFDSKFYCEVTSMHWIHPNFYELFSLTRYLPHFFSLPAYASWGIAAFLAFIGTAIWDYLDRDKSNYDELYYWLRVVLRYRLAIGIIAYGFIKLFTLQMPYPSLSNLHTNYGDFAPWKIYYHTIGITPWYESFLGAVEISTGVLLFFRRTTTFGAGIILGFAGNVFAANVSYDIGEQAYSFFLLLIAAYLFAYDVPRLYALLIKRKKAIANKFKPQYKQKALTRLRITLKTAFVLFTIFFAVETYGSYKDAPYKFPKTTGLKNSYGLYNVREFKFNNDLIAYSITDPNRWQNVVFEKWATLSIKIARPLKVDDSYGEEYRENDADRNFESAGVAGRHYFSYAADTLQQTLTLQNKNSNHSTEKFLLHYSWKTDSTLVLRGVDEKNDSIVAVLERINKKYLLFEGRRKPIKL